MWLILIGETFQYILISLSNFSFNLMALIVLDIVSSTIVTTSYSIQDWPVSFVLN